VRRLVYILATIGYVVSFLIALMPTLCALQPFWAWVRVGGFALVAVLSGKGTQRLWPALAVAVGLAGSVHAYRYNCRVIESMRELPRRNAAQLHQLIQQTETNALSEVQTNQATLYEAKLSPFGCCR
jgi:hypothetical protein